MRAVDTPSILPGARHPLQCESLDPQAWAVVEITQLPLQPLAAPAVAGRAARLAFAAAHASREWILLHNVVSFGLVSDFYVFSLPAARYCNLHKVRLSVVLIYSFGAMSALSTPTRPWSCLCGDGGMSACRPSLSSKVVVYL